MEGCKRICDQHQGQCAGFVVRDRDGSCFWKGGTLAPYSLSGHTSLQNMTCSQILTLIVAFVAGGVCKNCLGGVVALECVYASDIIKGS